ncbi:MAG: rhomboid family intramembrane serine protease [Syntrophobacteraceae bacterium]
MSFRNNVEITFTCVALLWIVYFIGLLLPFDLLSYGIRPRSVDGLPGLLFAPFLHAGINHLVSNTLALAALLFFSLMYSRKLTFKAIIIIALIGGGGTWLFGTPNTVHVGASGIIFGLVGYLLAIGFFRRELLALLVSIAVACYYGWALFSLFIVLPGVSWAGHFFGFGSGILAAWITRGEKTA